MNTITHAGVTYSQMVRTLAKPGVDILVSLTPLDCEKWHMASCIPGEVAELVEASADGVIEELGDLEFYLEGLRQAYNISQSDTISVGPVSYDDCLRDLIIASGEVFDVVKREIIYRKPVDMNRLLLNLRLMDGAMQRMRAEYQLSWEEVLLANMRKLEKRYSKYQYSNAAAQARADKVNESPDFNRDVTATD